VLIASRASSAFAEIIFNAPEQDHGDDPAYDHNHSHFHGDSSSSEDEKDK
jgi:hypothetical protein